MEYLENALDYEYKPVLNHLQQKLIEKEFLREKDQCYLEHAGTTLYSETQIQRVMEDLTTNIYGNPHSRSDSSTLTTDAIDQIRYEVLKFFNANPEEYSVIFTSGATGALKLVAEIFDYENEEGEHGTFVYLEDNHTSVLGMREYAKHSECILQKEALEIFANQETLVENERKYAHTNSLFVYPAQCNFSGTKYPLSWIEQVKQGALNRFNKINGSKNWYTMLDTASFVSTNKLDLSKHKPDFSCVSFYKIFGYPTGLGALIVKKSSARALKKKYFGGGSIFMGLATERFHIPRDTLYEYFEDGTVSFLSIASLRHGFDTLKRLSLDMNYISKHTFGLAQYVYHSLSVLHHRNGNPVAILYHDTNFKDITRQGAIVTFNLFRPTGEYVGFAEVMHIANLYGIQLRTGCFCNPGACYRHLDLSIDDAHHHYKSGHVCGDQTDLIDDNPTGAVRISFGYMTTKLHCDKFLNMIEDCFVTKPTIRQLPEVYRIKTNFERLTHSHLKVTNNEADESVATEGTFHKIIIYPIKSCAGFEVSDWELVDTGLKFDRQWMIVNANGSAVTQKHNPRLCLIKPEIDLKNDLLKLTFGDSETSIALNSDENTIKVVLDATCHSKVCTDRVEGLDCGDEIASWLSVVLKTPNLRLLKQSGDSKKKRIPKRGRKLPLSLANEAQYLLINSASVKWLKDSIVDEEFKQDLEGMTLRFRPNFVMDFGSPLVESNFSHINFEDLPFKVERLCTRCHMICIDQSTGEKSVEPLRTLSKELNGKIAFGVYLSHDPQPSHNRVSTSHKITGRYLF